MPDRAEQPSVQQERWMIYRKRLPNWRAALAHQIAAEGVDGPDTDGWIEVIPADRERVLVEALERRDAVIAHLARVHHDTITPSRKHDPEAREWWECDCLTCSAARSALDPVEVFTGLKDWWAGK